MFTRIAGKLTNAYRNRLCGIALVLLGTSCDTTTNFSIDEKTTPSSTPIMQLPFRTGPISYLALGDSYTIGQGVDLAQSYPHLLTEKLKKRDLEVNEPVIIAVTGWTTQDLLQGIKRAELTGRTFDLVTLLIGVNNQYRGLPESEYEKDFELLLAKSVTLSGGEKDRIIVLSIPDWGVTPYAEQLARDKSTIAAEIDRFNAINKKLSESHGIRYLEITEEYRSLGHMEQYLAVDGLHPSENVYDRWAELLTEIIINEKNIR